MSQYNEASSDLLDPVIITRRNARYKRQFWTERGWTFRRLAARPLERPNAKRKLRQMREEQPGWTFGMISAALADKDN